MNRPSLAALVLVAAACTKGHLGGALAEIAFNRTDDSPACVRVLSTDATTLSDATPTSSSTELFITDRGRTGEVAVAIGRPTGWSTQMEIAVTLHLGTCAASPVSSETQRVTLAPNQISTVLFTLTQPGSTDGGRNDAGPRPDGGPPDAGPIDAGQSDAGAPDAATPDAGSHDGGASDSGTMMPDAGPGDAGQGDAGQPDAGPADAGPPDAGNCTFALLPSPQAKQFNAVAMFDVGVAMLAGEAGAIQAALRQSDGSTAFEDWFSGSCSEDLNAVLVQSQDKVYVTTAHGRVHLFTSKGMCEPNKAFVDAGTVTGMSSYPIVAGTRVWVSTRNPGGIGGVTLNMQGAVMMGEVDLYTGALGLGSAGNDVLGVAGTSDSNVFAVGANGSNGFMLKLDTTLHLWSPVVLPGTRATLRAIAFADAAHGYAAGEELYVFDGSNWSAGPNPPLEVYGLTVLGVDDVLAVGAASDGMGLGIARFNGVSWQRLAAPSSTTNVLSGIAANSRCDVFAVGPDAGIVRSQP